MHPEDPVASMWVGNVRMFDGVLTFCMEGGKYSPWEDGARAGFTLGPVETDFQNQRGDHIGVRDTAALAYIMRQWGATDDANTGIGGQMAVWMLTDGQFHGADALGVDYVNLANTMVAEGRAHGVVSATGQVSIGQVSPAATRVSTDVQLVHGDGSTTWLDRGAADGVMTLSGAHFADGTTSHAVRNGDVVDVVPDVSGTGSQHVAAVVDYGEESLGSGIRAYQPTDGEYQRMIAAAPAPLPVRAQADAVVATDLDHGSVTWQKTDATDSTLIAGSSWTITPAGGAPVAVVDNGAGDVDPAAGVLRVDGLALGSYELRESAAPRGYELADRVYPFTIARGQATVALDAVRNTRVLGSVAFAKGDGGGAKGDIVEGTSWRLDGPGGQSIVLVDGGSNDADERPGRLKATGLAWGEWTLTETATKAGYVLNAQPQSFRVQASLVDVHLGTILNGRAGGQVGWQKVDVDTRALLAGSTWQLIPVLEAPATGTPTAAPTGAPTPTGAPVPADAAAEPITVVDDGEMDADPTPGVIRVEGLDWGTYELREVTAPAGYDLTAERPRFTVGGAALVASLGEIGDARIIGSVTWQKVDAETRGLLAGSSWTITGPDGTEAAVVDDGVRDAAPEAGVLRVQGLVPGRYELREVVAPEGYQLVSEPIGFEITDTERLVDLGQLVNRKTEVLAQTGAAGVDALVLGGALTLLGGAAAFVLRRRVSQI